MKKFRVHNEASNEKFKNLIENENLDQVFANEQYNEFCKIYTTLYDSSFPLKSKIGHAQKMCTKILNHGFCHGLKTLVGIKMTYTLLQLTFLLKQTSMRARKWTSYIKKIAQDKYHKKYFETYKDYSKNNGAWSTGPA